MKKILSHKELLDNLRADKKDYLLLYKSSGSPVNSCAYSSIEDAMKEVPNLNVLVADVSEVRDIHPNYPIDSVPVLVEFEDKKFSSVYKGCNGIVYYKTIFSGAVNYSGSTKQSAPNVVVYSTPTCSWCNTLKSYLRQNGVSFRDIDVSRDESAAREMVNRSGQHGVPQSIINGNLVVGFDKARINQLLGIN